MFNFGSKTCFRTLQCVFLVICVATYALLYFDQLVWFTPRFTEHANLQSFRGYLSRWSLNSDYTHNSTDKKYEAQSNSSPSCDQNTKPANLDKHGSLQIHGQNFEQYHGSVDNNATGNATNENHTESASDHGEYTADWRAVQDDILYVYSAHLDPRDGTSRVRVFGAMHKDHIKDAIDCHISVLGSAGGITKATTTRVAGADVMFPDVVLTCTFGNDPWSFPDDTRISFRIAGNLSDTQLKVEQNFKHSEKRTFTVCMWSALYTNESDWFVEWIEMNSMFGADLFYIYDLDAGPKVKAIMDYYVQLGILKVLPWHKPQPTLSGRIAHINFQDTLLGDCQHRNINKTKYVVGIDFDELIVPRGNKTTWQQMIDNSGCGPNSAFIARHLLFEVSVRAKYDPVCYSDARCNGSACLLRSGMRHDVVLSHLLTITNYSHLFLRTICVTERLEHILAFAHRSKYISSPVFSSRFGVHRPFGAHPCVMSIHVGTLNHYRSHGIWSLPQGKKYDNYLHIHLATIIERVLHVRAALHMDDN